MDLLFILTFSRNYNEGKLLFFAQKTQEKMLKNKEKYNINPLESIQTILNTLY